MAGLNLELARLTGVSERWPFTLLDELDSEDANNQLWSLVDIMDRDRFEKGTGSQLCSYLDFIELDEQFLRLLADHTGRGSSWEIVQNHCKLANLSQSFYRCISVEQWLRTVIKAELCQNHAIKIHSNVVPQQAYLRRFEEVMSTCTGNECNGGFFPTTLYCELGERPSQSCTNCALAEQLRGSLAQTSGAVARFWYLMEEKDVSLVDEHARLGEGSSEGEVYKILWRKGIFVKKVFKREFDDNTPRHCVSFDNEIEVAMAISHPNIVYCFGYAFWESADHKQCEFSMFMELLDEDLESHLTDRDLKGDFGFSFRDTLHILLQIAKAMEHFHEKKFVHGDLKPGNILVSQLPMPHSDAKFYLVKVADFGCAQLVKSVSGATVQPFNSKIGSVPYTAPEIVRCRKPYGEAPPINPQKADVFSFGVIAFQVLTGATSSDIRQGYSRSRLIKPDADADQWRPDRNFDFETREPDRLSLLNLIKRCWASSPESRPTFTEICHEIHSPIRSSKYVAPIINCEHRKAPNNARSADQFNTVHAYSSI
ncbi:hypothetical protein M758_8G029700 [Ceratodon purpureus]|nr:hypothetical protein M758_8G029700 [Ceratodon purpureus]